MRLFFVLIIGILSVSNVEGESIAVSPDKLMIDSGGSAQFSIFNSGLSPLKFRVYSEEPSLSFDKPEGIIVQGNNVVVKVKSTSLINLKSKILVSSVSDTGGVAVQLGVVIPVEIVSESAGFPVPFIGFIVSLGVVMSGLFSYFLLRGTATKLISYILNPS